MSSSPRTSLLVFAVAVASACVSGSEHSRTDSAYDNRDQFAEPGDVRFGNRGSGADGGGFSVSVGEDFGSPQAREVLRRLVALDSAGEFDQFTCGEKAPHFGFDITTHRISAYSDSHVTLAYAPYAKPMGKDACLASGFTYVVERTFAEVDTGPSADGGYTNMSTGEKIAPWTAGQRHSRWWPTCHCEMSRDNPDWVTNGPEETSIGADAH